MIILRLSALVAVKNLIELQELQSLEKQIENFYFNEQLNCLFLNDFVIFTLSY